MRGAGKGRERKGSVRALRMGVDASLVGLRLGLGFGRREKGNGERRSWGLVRSIAGVWVEEVMAREGRS